MIVSQVSPTASGEKKPLAIDLFCGLGGWTEGLLSEGYQVIGFDIEKHEYGDERYPGQLVIQDVLTIHGSQFKDAALIVASPPCQEYSYMAMPWSLAKAKAAAIRADETGEAHKRLTALFDACFRIQREACEAAGHHIPMVVENVRGAQPWVGRAAYNYGSFYLWGDIPALMPYARHAKNAGAGGGSWFNIGAPGQTSVGGNPDGRKVPSLETGRRTDPGKGARFTSRDCGIEGLKSPSSRGGWFGDGNAAGHGRQHAHKSHARKAASAKIAKIPVALGSHIARVYKPRAILEAAA